MKTTTGPNPTEVRATIKPGIDARATRRGFTSPARATRPPARRGRPAAGTPKAVRAPFPRPRGGAFDPFDTMAGGGEFLWRLTPGRETLIGGLPEREPSGPITDEGRLF